MWNAVQKGYWTAEVAEILGIAAVTVRKWASLFEAKGYRFAADEHGRRAFTESDVLMFRHYVELTQSKGMNQDAAIDVCVARHPGGELAEISSSDTGAIETIKRYEERYEQMMKVIETVSSQNTEILDRLGKQEKWIEESLNRRDQELTAALRKMLEDRQSRRKWWPFGRS